MANTVAKKRGPAAHRPRLEVAIEGMPELRAAAKAGHLRAELHVPLSPKGLGAVAIVLAADEEIVSRVPLALEDDGGRALEGEAILIAKREALPRMKLSADDPRLADLARVLARETTRP